MKDAYFAILIIALLSLINVVFVTMAADDEVNDASSRAWKYVGGLALSLATTAIMTFNEIAFLKEILIVKGIIYIAGSLFMVDKFNYYSARMPMKISMLVLTIGLLLLVAGMNLSNMSHY